MAYFTKEVNPNLDELSLDFNGGLAKLLLTSLVNEVTGVYMGTRETEAGIKDGDM